MRSWRKSLWTFSQDADWYVSIILVFTIAILGVLNKVEQSTILIVTILVLGLLAIGNIRDRSSTKKLINAIDSLGESLDCIKTSDHLISDRGETGIERVFPRSINHNWIPDIEASHNIVIAKIRANFTEDPSYYRAFESVIERQGSVTIIMSDPRSPSMWLRYSDEPHPLGDTFDETAWARGIEELAGEIIHLYTWRARLKKDGIDINRLSIKLFPHYPTQGIYKFDSKIYVYSYPFQKRGYHGPAFLFSNPNTTTHKFLCGCIDAIVSASIPIEDAYQDILDKYNSGLFSDTHVLKAQISVE